MRSLDELTDALPAHVRGELTVDLSDQFDEPAGTTVLRLTEPLTDEFAAASAKARRTRVNHPELTDEQAFFVTLLGAMHREPGSASVTPAAFYARMALTNQPLFLIVQASVVRAFPWLQRLYEQGQEKKG